MKDGVRKIQITRALRVHSEFIPEQGLFSVTIPVALYKIRISVQRVTRPFGNVVTAVVEPVYLPGKIGLSYLPVAVCSSANGHLRTRYLFKEFTYLYLLAVLGHILPEDLASFRFINDHTHFAV